MPPRRQFIKVVIICSILAVFMAEVTRSADCPISTACVPGPRNLVKMEHKTVTATNTCGNPPTRYCSVKPPNKCDWCNESDHTVDKMTDDDVSTRWQSVTWWDWYQNNNKTDEPLKVNVRISFNKTYLITGVIRLIFKSPRPIEMILEKSDDKGKTWTALQYYAEDCLRRFNMSSTPDESISKGDFGLYCVEDYSDFLPEEDGEVKFDFLQRYSTRGFWNRTLQEYLSATDIRVQMLHPGTEGQNNLEIKTEDIFNQYFYSIGDLRVIGRCQCHGHAKFCDYPDRVGKNCDCQHSTEGEDCDRCKPLFNNKTWMPATSDDEPNPCEKCQCYEHANSCHYNLTLDHGVCDNCEHNTTGLFCEKCLDTFYRNMSKPLDDPAVCLSCNCVMFGITNNGTCNQTTGQCECKQNVTGRQCGQCEDTFWGFDLSPKGDCRECGCNANGTKNGNLSCNQISGKCPCKDNIYQRTCSECRNGFFSFPTNVTTDCLQCDCDYGGSLETICEKENGTCLCRNHIEGKRCMEATPGFFVPSLDYLKYEAEDASGNYTPTSYFTGVNQYFTGRGYAKIEQNQHITFLFNNNRSFSFSFSSYIVLRYSKLKEDNETLRLTVSSCNSSQCHEIRDITISLLLTGYGLAWKSEEPVYFQRGRVYNFMLAFIEGSYANSSVEIDSLILLPDISHTSVYVTAQSLGEVHGMTFNQIEACWNTSTTIPGLSNNPNICDNVTFSVMAEVFDGALPCSCNSTGTENDTMCMQLGGQCHCKPGVTGLSCDRCLPGYFNFTDSGCTACDCSDLGSTDLVCHPVTGQCLCKPGVVTRTCGRCNASYFGFHTGKGCVECRCNISGSADLQCDSSGVCTCKNSTSGKKCDMCRENFFNFTSEGCQACNCNEGGSSSLQCDQSMGICQCKANAEGHKCERCKNGTHNSDPYNPDGCSPCFCYGRSSRCSSAQGFVRSHIQASFTSNDNFQINKSPEGILFKTLGEGLQINFTAGTFVKLTFENPFKGNQLPSYTQLFMLTMNYSSLNDSLLAAWNLTLKGPNLNEASFNITPPPSTSNKEYNSRLHEHYTLNNLTAFELQRILVDIESVQLHGSFMSFGAVTIDVKLVTATKGVGEEVGFVENCTCPNNYTEQSCGFCNSGYTRTKPRSFPTPWTPCVLCSCSGRSADCYPENGTCYNCRTGSEGEHCERCQQGVDNTTDCTLCRHEFFGLTPSSGGCQECDCVLPNTMYGNSSVCNKTSGTCTCKPKIGGRQCDRCHENAYNTSRGCVDCPECYRLVYEEVEQLRGSATTLEDTIDRLRNGNIGDVSFAERLSEAENRALGFLTEATEAREIEKNLTEEIKGLNETLNHLERVLRHELVPDLNELSTDLTSTLANRSTIQSLISLIRDAVRHSHNVLNMSISLSLREAKSMVEELIDLVPWFSELAMNFTSEANRKNATSFEIQVKVDEAEEKIYNAQFVAENATFEQKKLDKDLKHLKSRVDSIQTLAEKMNSTSYALHVNASNVLAQANETLSEVMSLDPAKNWDAMRRIVTAIENASTRAQDIVSQTQNITMRYQNLTFQIQQAMDDTKRLTYRVRNAQWQVQAILGEARRARTDGYNAVQLATKTLTDANEMLQILQNFEANSSEAQRLANQSLHRAIMYNFTSWNAIKYTQEINASLQDTLENATRGLALAQQASNLSNAENQEVSIIHHEANRLSQDASRSKYTTEYFGYIRLNVTSINSTTQPYIAACTQNYSSKASGALQQAYSAKREADEADTGAKNLKMTVDRLAQEVKRLPEVNMSGLAGLKKEIQTISTGLTQRNVTHIIRLLKRAKDDQQKFVDEYRTKVTQRRIEIAELKQLHESLLTTTCVPPSSETMLES